MASVTKDNLKSEPVSALKEHPPAAENSTIPQEDNWTTKYFSIDLTDDDSDELPPSLVPSKEEKGLSQDTVQHLSSFKNASPSKDISFQPYVSAVKDQNSSSFMTDNYSDISEDDISFQPYVSAVKDQNSSSFMTNNYSDISDDELYIELPRITVTRKSAKRKFPETKTLSSSCSFTETSPTVAKHPNKWKEPKKGCLESLPNVNNISLSEIFTQAGLTTGLNWENSEVKNLHEAESKKSIKDVESASDLKPLQNASCEGLSETKVTVTGSEVVVSDEEELSLKAELTSYSHSITSESKEKCRDKHVQTNVEDNCNNDTKDSDIDKSCVRKTDLYKTSVLNKDSGNTDSEFYKSRPEDINFVAEDKELESEYENMGKEDQDIELESETKDTGEEDEDNELESETKDTREEHEDNELESETKDTGEEHEDNELESETKDTREEDEDNELESETKDTREEDEDNELESEYKDTGEDDDSKTSAKEDERESTDNELSETETNSPEGLEKLSHFTEWLLIIPVDPSNFESIQGEVRQKVAVDFVIEERHILFYNTITSVAVPEACMLYYCRDVALALQNKAWNQLSRLLLDADFLQKRCMDYTEKAQKLSPMLDQLTKGTLKKMISLSLRKATRDNDYLLGMFTCSSEVEYLLLFINNISDPESPRDPKNPEKQVREVKAVGSVYQNTSFLEGIVPCMLVFSAAQTHKS